MGGAFRNDFKRGRLRYRTQFDAKALPPRVRIANLSNFTCSKLKARPRLMERVLPFFSLFLSFSFYPDSSLDMCSSLAFFFCLYINDFIVAYHILLFLISPLKLFSSRHLGCFTRELLLGNPRNHLVAFRNKRTRLETSLWYSAFAIKKIRKIRQKNKRNFKRKGQTVHE